MKYKVEKYVRSNDLRIVVFRVRLFERIVVHVYGDHCYVDLPSGFDNLRRRLSYFPGYVERGF